MKPNQMTQEVCDMIALRHSAEQRGNFEPLGRLQWARTDHGIIQFPAVEGECSGPDLAIAQSVIKEPTPVAPGSTILAGVVEVPESDTGGAWMVLGRWAGLPPLRVNTSKPCPKCRHACDVCPESSGKKLCELCGGQTWLAGPWLPCPGPGCVRDSGGFETGRIKDGCITCRGAGQIPEQRDCTMCEASGQMTCTRCRGTGKFSTGRVGGSIDSELTPRCKACSGTTFVGEWKRQDVKPFVNATLTTPRTAKVGPKGYLVLGPIREFAIVNYETFGSRIFTVTADASGDLLVLLVPRSPQQKPQKAYLVGGVVQERDLRSAVGA